MKLPVCPYCHSVYRYRDVVNISEKRHNCYHCGRAFEVSKAVGRTVLMLVICCVLIAFNVLLFYTSKNINIVVMAITDAAVISATILLFPLTVRFKSVKMTKSEKRKNKAK